MDAHEAETAIELDAVALDALRKEGAAHRILDVREPWEIGICAFDDSLNIPMGEISARVDELPREDPLVVVCHHGARSLRVALWLRGQGFGRATSLNGGIDAWSRQIDPSMPVY